MDGGVPEGQRGVHRPELRTVKRPSLVARGDEPAEPPARGVGSRRPPVALPVVQEPDRECADQTHRRDTDEYERGDQESQEGADSDLAAQVTDGERPVEDPRRSALVPAADEVVDGGEQERTEPDGEDRVGGADAEQPTVRPREQQADQRERRQTAPRDEYVAPSAGRVAESSPKRAEEDVAGEEDGPEERDREQRPGSPDDERKCRAEHPAAGRPRDPAEPDGEATPPVDSLTTH